MTDCARYNFSDVPLTHHKVLDGFILSSELDLLHIRLTELEGVVDKFVIVESSRTFTNRVKPLWWRDYGRHEDRFARFLPSIMHIVIPADEVQRHFDGELKPSAGIKSISGGGKWRVEAAHRRAIMFGFERASVLYKDVLLVGDVDEIPRRSTVNVFKYCQGYPEEIVLELDTFIAGFHTRSTVVPKRNSAARTFYNTSRSGIHEKKDWVAHHSRSTDYLFSSAGWHCTSCFGSLDLFTWKQLSYSHADRGVVDKAMLKSRICRGVDMYGFIPESFTWSSLFWRIALDMDVSSREVHSTLTLPKLVQHDPTLYSYLLNGCDVERKEYDLFLQSWIRNGRPTVSFTKEVKMTKVIEPPFCFFELIPEFDRVNNDEVLAGRCVHFVHRHTYWSRKNKVDFSLNNSLKLKNK